MISAGGGSKYRVLVIKFHLTRSTLLSMHASCCIAMTCQVANKQQVTVKVYMHSKLKGCRQGLGGSLVVLSSCYYVYKQLPQKDIQI